MEAWAEVSTETIANCWVHTGILPGMDTDIDEDTTQQDEIEVLREIDECIKSLHLPEPMSVEYLLDFPSEREINDLPQIEEIIEACRIDDDDNGEDEEDEEPRVVSCKEASQALETLRLFTLQSENAEEETESIGKFAKLIARRMQMSLKQRSIDDYFKRI